MEQNQLLELLNSLANGQTTPEVALQQLQSAATPDAQLDLGFATLDLDRAQRCGQGEVVFGQGKTAEQIIAITQKLRIHLPCVLITRITDNTDTRAAIAQALAGDTLRWGAASGTLLVGTPPAPESIHNQPSPLRVPIVSAGTSDQAVAEEAELTCIAMGCPCIRINDVGVAGLHRLAHWLPTLRQAPVIVTVAGMEGALPSVIGGLVSCPVIAVPTSVGYGSSFGGIAALLGALNACASGVTVVNIDNGFGGAFAAVKIHRLATTPPPSTTTAKSPA